MLIRQEVDELRHRMTQMHFNVKHNATGIHVIDRLNVATLTV